MLRNFFIAALRNLVRNRFYSVIGIFVLAIGLSAAILMSLYIRAQWSVDRFIPAYERTFTSVTVEALAGQAPIFDEKSPGKLAELLKLKFNEIEAVTRIVEQEVQLQRGKIDAKERIYWADKNVFDLLPLSVFVGDLGAALHRADGMVLTRSMARKYFGRDDPIGLQLQIDRAHLMTVTAVIDDLPVNSPQLESGIFASGLASFSLLTKHDNDPQSTPGHGLSWDVRTYLRLAPSASIDRLQNEMRAFGREYTGPPPMPGLLAYWQFVRFDRVHVFPGLNPGKEENYVMTAALGLSILFVACAVFVNLSTARSAQRALEVGIRKVCGAGKGVLALQFVGESLLRVMLAVVIAVALAELLLPLLNTFTDVRVRFDYWHHPALLAWVVASALVTGVFVGIYPALVLTSFRPADVLKGSINTHGGTLARQALVTLKFSVLIGFVIVAAVIYRQRLYATNEALRVNTDQILIIRPPCSQTFKDELRVLKGVRGAFCSSPYLLNGLSFANLKLKAGGQQAIGMTPIESGVLSLYGLKPVAGQFQSKNIDIDGATSSAAQYVINESAVQRIGFASPAAAIGQLIAMKLGDGREESGEIIGVVPDFSMLTIEQKIEPWIYPVTPNRYGISGIDGMINVKLTGREVPETLAEIDRLWRAVGAARPIERFFLSDHFQSLYLSVLRQAQMFGIFSCVAVLLACIGLVGLAASTTQRRTKEIGIRKAMGASTGAIMRLLVWQFTKPVLYATLLAWPIAAVAMNRWLQGFAYHIDLEPWIFVASSALALVVALATVSVHCYLVARAKPIHALRYE